LRITTSSPPIANVPRVPSAAQAARNAWSLRPLGDARQNAVGIAEQRLRAEIRAHAWNSGGAPNLARVRVRDQANGVR
jgi:hypothetical protein